MKQYHETISIRYLLCLILSFQVYAISQKEIPLPQGTINVTVGNLKTSSASRSIHYVYVPQSNPDDPQRLTLWFNGGPGCSSMYGFLQQIGPELFPQYTAYNEDVKLIKNQYSWNKMSNLLFFDSPSGVGFSHNSDPNYKHNDQNTATDNFDALLDFLDNFESTDKIRDMDLYIAGESYAGQYIPDLAMKIYFYNLQNPDTLINLKGILIFNGVMNWEANTLENSRVDFMIKHNFIDPKLLPYWEQSCKFDPESARCQFFLRKFEDLLYRTNPYNIYGTCSNKTAQGLSQGLMLHKVMKRFGQANENLKDRYKYCSYNAGIVGYFNNHDDFGSLDGEFKLCDEDIMSSYQVTPNGIMNKIPRLLSDTNTKIYYASGDWDDVVPFTNTLDNLYKMGLSQTSIAPWIIESQNIGMKRTFSNQEAGNKKNIMFWMVKKAGHEVPVDQRKPAFEIFKALINEK